MPLAHIMACLLGIVAGVGAVGVLAEAARIQRVLLLLRVVVGACSSGARQGRGFEGAGLARAPRRGPTYAACSAGSSQPAPGTHRGTVAPAGLPGSSGPEHILYWRWIWRCADCV